MLRSLKTWQWVLIALGVVLLVLLVLGLVTQQSGLNVSLNTFWSDNAERLTAPRRTG